MNILIILMILMSFPVLAQKKGSIEDDLKLLQEQRLKIETWEKEQTQRLSDTLATLEKNNERLAQLEDAEKNRKLYAEKVMKEVNEQIDGLSTSQRLLSKKGSLYRCIRNELSQNQVANVSKCQKSHPAALNAEEQKILNNWHKQAGLNSSQIKIEREKILADNKNKDITLTSTRSMLSQIPSMKEMQLSKENSLKFRVDNQKIIKANQKYLNCDANTPDISLEEVVPYPGASFKGPFVGVPRDNQDGIGSCYANVAKNLLVGVSKGEDIASFLDVALTYKGSEGVTSSGLDAGESCVALSRLQERGFCPQENAPMEMGEKNSFSNKSLLGGSQDSIADQAVVVDLMQKFFEGRKVLEQGDKTFSDKFLKQSKALVHNIKLRPNVKIPMPIVRYPIPTSWKLADLHSKLQSKNPLLTFDQLNDDYKKEYRKFYPAYVRGVIEGKSRDEIFASFESKMSNFISKYGLSSEMKNWKNSFMVDTNGDANSSSLRSDIAQAVDFMKLMSGKKGKSDQEFLKFCDDTQGDSLQFLSTLQPLIKHLNDSGMSTDELYDKDGKFRNPQDMIQLLIAPSCLHADNRKKFTYPASCENGVETIYKIKTSALPQNEKVKEFRGRVVASLIQGYPLGNSFRKHINTIVGLRYNKTNGKCEYKIRESQNGTSTWQNENTLFDSIESLTEVRRK